jgi:uncharacterized protein (DUF1684 family)
MIKLIQIKIFTVPAIVVLLTSAGFAQKVTSGAKTVSAIKPNKMIFAVTNEGQTLEPIAYIENGRLVNADGGDAETQTLKTFSKAYYAPKASYTLIFGGSAAGKVQVVSNDPASDCGKNLAQVSVQSTRTNLKSFVMALATNAPPKTTVTGVRRPPTAAERAEVETLVRAEFTKQKVPANAQKTLHYHNLTALDVDNDGKAELVGSYWVATAPTERGLLFFIAGKNADGKYVFEYSHFEKIKQDAVMSNDIKDLDKGFYNELLLDTFDYNGDGTGEIFTIVQAFEGNNFNVYRRESGKWVKTLERYNYHCAF